MIGVGVWDDVSVAVWDVVRVDLCVGSWFRWSSASSLEKMQVCVWCGVGVGVWVWVCGGEGVALRRRAEQSADSRSVKRRVL